MTFGQLIKRQREKLGLTHNEVAFKAGISSRQYIGMLEQDVSGPSLDTARKLAKVLKLDPAAVMKTTKA